MPVEFTPTAPTPTPPTRSPPSAILSWLLPYADQVRRDIQAIQAAFRRAARYDFATADADDGADVVVKHGLGVVPTHTSLTVSGGIATVDLVSASRQTVTLRIATTPAAESRVVSVGVFA